MTTPSSPPAFLTQVSFAADPAACGTFTPNRLRSDFCTECSRLIWSHARAAIGDDEHIRAALEYTTKGKSKPSAVLPDLYLGGLNAVLNAKFLADNHVTGIVTAAGGLEMFGPRWVRARARAQDELGIEFLDLDLCDAEDQGIEPEVLLKAVRFVQKHRGGDGKSCLVHCAMGKSRSTTVILAYLMSLPAKRDGGVDDDGSVRGGGVEETLAWVKTKRAMAQPNAGFMRQLKEFKSAGLFANALMEEVE